MSGRDERKLVDVRGRYRWVRRDGERVAEDGWRECRLVVTTRRLVLGTDDGTRSVSHEDAALLDADALPDAVDPDAGTPVQFADAVLLLDAGTDVDLERARHRAVVEGGVVLARPRAVVDGQDRDDAGWRKARVRLSDGRVTVSTKDGDTVAFDADAVAAVETRRETVAGEERTVVAVGYEADGGAVETHFSGTDRSTDALAGLFRSLADASDGAPSSDASGAAEDGDADGAGDAGGAAEDADGADGAGDAGGATEDGDADGAGDAGGTTDADDAGGITAPGDDAEFAPADLSETDRRVLVALYSGVSPFEVADFVGMEVDEVEATFQRLLAAGVVDEVRTRTEVVINGTGRNVASESMSEE